MGTKFLDSGNVLWSHKMMTFVLVAQHRLWFLKTEVPGGPYMFGIVYQYKLWEAQLRERIDRTRLLKYLDLFPSREGK